MPSSRLTNAALTRADFIDDPGAGTTRGGGRLARELLCLSGMPESTIDPAAVRRRLYGQRDALARRLNQENRDEDDLVSERDSEFEDLAGRHGLADLLDRFGERDLRELARIDLALGRVDAGTYGRCTACGDRIAVDRLLALPEAERCTDCQEMAEPPAL